MNKAKKFENFLESLKGTAQDNLIESVKKGFLACFESYDFDDLDLDLGYEVQEHEKEMRDRLPEKCEKCEASFSIPRSIDRLHYIPEDPDGDVELLEEGRYNLKTQKFEVNNVPKETMRSYPPQKDWMHIDHCNNCSYFVDEAFTLEDDIL